MTTNKNSNSSIKLEVGISSQNKWLLGRFSPSYCPSRRVQQNVCMVINISSMSDCISAGKEYLFLVAVIAAPAHAVDRTLRRKRKNRRATFSLTSSLPQQFAAQKMSKGLTRIQVWEHLQPTSNHAFEASNIQPKSH